MTDYIKQLESKVKDCKNTNTIFDTRKYVLLEDAKEVLNKALNITVVSGSATVDINTQVEILKKVINKLMITFDDENDRMDYILDICNEYRKEAEKHYR